MMSTKQTAQGMFFMNEQQPNSQKYKDCLGRQLCKTQLL